MIFGTDTVGTILAFYPLAAAACGVPPSARAAALFNFWPFSFWPFSLGQGSWGRRSWRALPVRSGWPL